MPAPIVPRDKRPNDTESWLLLPEIKTLFWSRVAKSGPDECWLWLRGCASGYGALWNPITKHRIRAHRIAYFYEHGQFPSEGRHTCDNPPCCNPAHILDGTHRENMHDCIARGRFPSGMRAGKAKLTHETIRAILADRRSSRAIAQDYGIGKSTVGNLKRGESYLEVQR